MAVAQVFLFFIDIWGDLLKLTETFTGHVGEKASLS
jgi:hypothetical protein